MSSANEIYQAVLEQCLKQIDGIKKEYGNQLASIIISQISEKYDARIARLENENKKLKKELSKLKSEMEMDMEREVPSHDEISFHNPAHMSFKDMIDYYFMGN